MNYCATGSLVGPVNGTTTNGIIYFSWCKGSLNNAEHITIKYDKSAGSSLWATFGYQWVNSNGGAQTDRTWDSSGDIYMTAGDVAGRRWNFSPSLKAPAGAACLQGLMRVNGRVYLSHVDCPWY
jgi:hypothetical protein